MRSSATLLLPFLVVSGCGGPPADDGAPPNRSSGGATHEEAATRADVAAYRACDFASPGQLVALPRAVPGEAEPVAAALREVVGGVSQDERAQGCTSFFSAATADAVITVSRTDGGTLHVDFADFSDQLPDAPGVKSFLPPGVMAELTWTIFDQFPEIDAVRFSFDGDEAAFWRWLTGDGSDAEAFTREMWERI